MANFFTMTNHDLHGHMGFFGFVFSLGIGLLSGYLTYYNLLHTLCGYFSYSTKPSRCDYSYEEQNIQAGINAGISLTVIGGVFGFCSCIWLGKRLETAETTTTRTARNTTLTEIITTRNQETIELNPLGQEVKNLGTEAN